MPPSKTEISPTYFATPYISTYRECQFTKRVYTISTATICQQHSASYPPNPKNVTHHTPLNRPLSSPPHPHNPYRPTPFPPLPIPHPGRSVLLQPPALPTYTPPFRIRTLIRRQGIRDGILSRGGIPRRRSKRRYFD